MKSSNFETTQTSQKLEKGDDHSVSVSCSEPDEQPDVDGESDGDDMQTNTIGRNASSLVLGRL